MADDLNKNITIQVTAQTDQLEQSITDLSKMINDLLAQQKQLIDTGNQTSAAFQNNADKIDIFQKSLQNATTQLNTYLNILNSSATAIQKNQSLITALTGAKDKYSKTVGDSAKKVNDLNSAINNLSSAVQQQTTQTTQSKSAIDANNKSLKDSTASANNLQTGLSSVSTVLQQQQTDIKNNKTAFDEHKATIDHLKTSFDEIKNISGEFGPSLQQAAKGFSMMKSGLDVVKDGLTGVGTALKADDFDFLLQILQSIFDAFVHSSEGSKILQGVISAIGVVVNKVTGFFGSFMNGIINAVSHPVESIKALGKMIEQNIINRFTAFGTILDGIIHLDFKKITDGAIQAATGVTHATDKMSSAFTSVENAVTGTATAMVQAYKKGYDEVDQISDTSTKNVLENFNKQKKAYSDAGKTSVSIANNTTVSFFPPPPVNKDTENEPLTIGSLNINATNAPEIKTAQATSNEVVKIKKTALQQIEAYAKQSAGKIATDTLSILSGSIKQQSDAKIAALQKDEAAELSNTSLTSAQKLAIQQKYKNQEDQVKKKAFKEEQDVSIAQAIINGALAITKGTAQTGILAELYIPTIIAETAAQVAKIAAQKPPAYASGGLHYASDGRGGVLPGYSRSDNTNAYLSSGEGIVVSEAMREPWARNLVSAINVGFGGRDFSTAATGRAFAVGGVFTDGGNANRYYNQPVNDQKNLANTIAYQMINNFPPVYVDVKDINNQQNILAQTINRVNL